MELQNNKRKESQNSNRIAIAAIAANMCVLVVSTVTIGSIRIALAANDNTIVSHFNNAGVNVQTDTNQKQDCKTAGESSGISGSCQATSTDRITQRGWGV
jgi:hypothetical protein